MRSPSVGPKADRTRTRYLWSTGVLFGALALSLLAYARGALDGRAAAPESKAVSGDGAVRFTDARQQAVEFIAYDRSILLTPEQQAVMKEALSSIPAPCCERYSIATCCCPCNLARSTWGLSKFLIARQHATTTQVRAAASEWLRFTNPTGYSGDACFSQGCNRSFEHNGCGGMDDRHIR